jgi:hypothetical protein
MEPIVAKAWINCQVRMVLLPWLPNLTLHSLTLAGANFESISKVRYFGMV